MWLFKWRDCSMMKNGVSLFRIFGWSSLFLICFEYYFVVYRLTEIPKLMLSPWKIKDGIHRDLVIDMHFQGLLNLSWNSRRRSWDHRHIIFTCRKNGFLNYQSNHLGFVWPSHHLLFFVLQVRKIRLNNLYYSFVNLRSLQHHQYQSEIWKVLTQSVL